MKLTFDQSADALYFHLTNWWTFGASYLCDPQKVGMINVDLSKENKILWIEIMSSSYFSEDILTWKSLPLIIENNEKKYLDIIFSDSIIYNKFINDDFIYNTECNDESTKELFWKLEIGFNNPKKIIYIRIYTINNLIDRSFSKNIEWELN